MTRESLDMHLRLIDEALHELHNKRALSLEEFLADPTAQAAVAHWIQQIVESSFKMALAIINLRKLKAARTYKGAFRSLYHGGIISENLNDKLEALADFRNLLVHVYWAVDPRQVYGILTSGIGAAEEFVQIAAKMLRGQ